MEYIVYIVIASLAIPLVFGLLLGMIRGSRRATLRLLLVLLCIVAAFCLKDVIGEQMMHFDIQGQPLEDYVLSQLPEEMQSMGEEVVLPIVQMIVTTIVFVVMFMLVKFVSWLIIFPIFKIFIKKARKKKDGTYGNKHALIGGVVGLVQGAAVGLVLCITLNGLLVNVGNIMEAANDFNDSSNNEPNAVVMMSDEEEGGGDTLEIDYIKEIIDYKKSGISQTISKTGGDKVFDLVACMKTEDGEKLTLSGQLDALGGLMRMAKQLMALEDMDMIGGLTGNVATDIEGIFNKLDEICGDLSDESKKAMNNILQIAADSLLPEGSGIDVSILNFETVSFSNEGQVISKLSSYKEEDFENLTEAQAKEKATEIVNTVMQSDIILPLLSSNDEFTIGLNEEQQAFAKDVIDELASRPETDQEKIDMLRKFFGLNDNSENDTGNIDIIL